MNTKLYRVLVRIFAALWLLLFVGGIYTVVHFIIKFW